jgi:hypothetical protein
MRDNAHICLSFQMAGSQTCCLSPDLHLLSITWHEPLSLRCATCCVQFCDRSDGQEAWYGCDSNTGNDLTSDRLGRCTSRCFQVSWAQAWQLS